MAIEDCRVEVDSISEQAQEKIELVESADLVVGVLPGLGKDGVTVLCEELRTLPGSPRIVVLRSDLTGNEAAPSPQATEGRSPVSLLPWSVLGPDPTATPRRIATMGMQLAAPSSRIGFRLGRALLRATQAAGIAE